MSRQTQAVAACQNCSRPKTYHTRDEADACKRALNGPHIIPTSQQRADTLWNIIKKYKIITRLQIQNNEKWGDGIMYRAHKGMMSEHEEQVNWIPKKSKYILLDNVQGKLA